MGDLHCVRCNRPVEATHKTCAYCGWEIKVDEARERAKSLHRAMLLHHVWRVVKYALGLILLTGLVFLLLRFVAK